MSIARKINGSWQEIAGATPIDIELSSTSTNPVQNKVVTKAIDDIIPVSRKWDNYTWNGVTEFNGSDIWTDGTDIYLIDSGDNYILNKSTSTWSSITFDNMSNMLAICVWTDGTDVYYSNWSNQYVFDKSTKTWSTKTWNGLENFDGNTIWTDGTDTYISDGFGNYVLDKSTSTWSEKTWYGETGIHGSWIWTDGVDIYFSNGTYNYVLDKSTSTWSTKTWNGLNGASLFASNIWTDGVDIYSSGGAAGQYKLDKDTSTWEPISWNVSTNLGGDYVWSDGEYLYYSDGNRNYKYYRTEGFGIAAQKDFTTSVTSGSEDLITSGAVYSAVGQAVRFEVTTSSWAEDTTSQSGKTLYKKSISLNNVYVDSPSVNIGSIGVLPTIAQQAAYNLLQYVTVDSAVPCLYLYASNIPTNTFYINVEGVD